MKNIGRKAIVTGHVQCVGFRYYTSREAGKLGLTGHAKNLNCGDVEVILYGDSDKVNLMLKWLENGPTTAHVDALTISDITYIKEHNFSCL